MNFNRIGLTLVAAALVSVYGCGKEEPKKAEAPKTTTTTTTTAAPTPPADDTVTVKIGHAGPLTGGIAHLGKDNENGARLAVEQATGKKLKIGGKTVKFELHGRGRPGRREARPDDRAEVRRMRRLPASSAISIPASRFPRRPSQPGRPADDLRLGDQPEADRAGLQEHLPHRRPRRPARPGRRAVPAVDESQEGRGRSTTRPPTAKGSPTKSRRR